MINTVAGAQGTLSKSAASTDTGNDVEDTTHLESEVRYYGRAFPRVFDRASGATLWDTAGNRYLDFFAGCGALNYGHNHPVLKKALLDYVMSDSITHGLDLQTPARNRFLKAVDEILLKPRGLDYVMQFTGPTGTNAVEAALKLARKVTGRTNVICFTNGFHGMSLGSLAATGSKYHRGPAGVPLSGTTTMPFDGYMGDEFNTIDYLARLLSDQSSGLDTPAAVIVETVQGEGGLNMASPEWLRRLRRVCDEHGIMMIVDDIQAGCGRTGTFFSFEPSGIQPDIVVLSKSFSGYGLPLAAILLRRKLDEWKPAEHNGTFRGNNHAFVTATAALEHFWKDPSFSLDLQRKSEYLNSRLQTLVDKFSPEMEKVKGRGMMQGVSFRDPEQAKAVASRAFGYGLLIERAGPEDEVVKCLMPLTITTDELKEGLDILERSCLEVLRDDIDETSSSTSFSTIRVFVSQTLGALKS
jgi:diaminobutyrate-2-oxoglutarate transaminase